jgi:hypothetical protein
MADASIPVDLFNPGQVFACLGFLEAADVLLGDAEGGFDWSNNADTRFKLRANGVENPFEHVLAFLAEAEIKRFGPTGYTDPPPKGGGGGDEDDDDEESEIGDDAGGGAGLEPATIPGPETSDAFPARTGDRMALPIRFGGSNRPVVELSHWADGDAGRQSFKLYSGNRAADRIARAMLAGVRKKPTRKQAAANQPGDLISKGLRQLWDERRDALVADPFNQITPMGGSFNLDPRGAWTAIDVGYSPNDQKHRIQASPVVEFLAAWGLENARPDEFDVRKVRYAAWGDLLPPLLARAALVGAIPAIPVKRFRFNLELSGKNKVVTFAELEIAP